MPAKPTTMPSRSGPLARWRSSTAATVAAKIGVAPLRSPVTDELMYCSAIGNSVNGTATQITESRTSRPRSEASIVTFGLGSTSSASAPDATRSNVISPGGKASRPMSMNRNDEPQIAATAMKRPQSRGVNEPSFAAVDRSNSLRCAGEEAGSVEVTCRR